MSGDFEPVQFGRYRLMRRLAVGGMAEIFQAKAYGAHGFEKTLVIKRILPQLAADKEFVRMFIGEAKVMVQLNHPKIVQVIDFGEVDDQYFIAMEYIEGLDGLGLLRTCATHRVRPTTGIVVHLIAEVLDALDYAHNLHVAGQHLGILHRDVSPSNIFISQQGEVKLGDFGIAQAIGDRPDETGGAIRGKYGYMSPEQVSDGEVDIRTDVFAAGVVLAELLMVRRLFFAKSELEVLLQVRDARLDRLDRYGQYIPPALREILECALARDPALRYQDAGQFRDVLHRYMYDDRRMIRTADVRRFLKSLEKAKAAPPPKTGRMDTWEVSVVGGTGEGLPPLPRHPPKAASSEERAAAREDRRPRRNTIELFRRVPSFGRKRKIHLAPPLPTEPIPKGVKDQSRRLDTDEALVAISDTATPGTANTDFRNSSGQWFAVDVDMDNLDSVSSDGQIDEEEAITSRIGTPGVGTPIMPAPDMKGDLARRSPFALLFRLAFEEESGLLVLASNGSMKQVFLKHGDPHFVLSNRTEELFGQYLVSRGVLSEGELAMALAMLPHFDGKLGDTLVALKLVRPVEVLRHLTHQVRHKLLDIFPWSGGTYTFHRGTECEYESAPLGLDAFELLGAGLDMLEPDAVMVRLQPHIEAHVFAVTPPAVPPEVFRLGARPREAFDKLTGKYSLRSLLQRFDDDQERVEFSKLVYLLLETGLAAV